MAGPRVVSLELRVKTREDPVDVARYADGEVWHALREMDKSATWCGNVISAGVVVEAGASWARVSCRRCRGGW